MAEDRKVTATLDLNLGPGTERAMRQVAEGMGRISQSVNAVQSAAGKAAGTTTGPPVVGAPTGAAADALARAGGNAPSGWFGRQAAGLGKAGEVLSGPLGGVAGAAAIGAVGLSAAATYSNLSANRFINEGQRQRSLLMSLPGASHVTRLVEDFAGRGPGMQEARVAAEQNALSTQQYAQRAPLVASEFIPQAGRQALSNAARAASPIFGERIDRTTATGEREFREQSRLLPVMREQAKIQRDMAKVTAEKSEAEFRHVIAVENEVKATNRLNTARQNESRLDREGVTGKALLAARLETANAEAGLTTATDVKRQARESVRAAQIAEGETKGRSLLARATESETRAGNFEERAATAAGSAQRLGGMNPVDRQFGIASLKALQTHGPDALSPEMMAAAGQLAPSTVGKILEKHGAGTREFAELKEIAPDDYTGNPEELRQKAEDARRDAAQARMEAERTMTQVAADAGRDFGLFIGNIIKSQIEAAKRGVEQQLKIQQTE